MNQTEAITAAGAHAAVAGHTWYLPQESDWQNMIAGCGNVAYTSSMNYTCLNAKLETAGGTALARSTNYWSSTGTTCPFFGETNADFTYTKETISKESVRACFDF
jgi:hypothetical protein